MMRKIRRLRAGIASAAVVLISASQPVYADCAGSGFRASEGSVMAQTNPKDGSETVMKCQNGEWVTIAKKEGTAKPQESQAIPSPKQ